MIAVDSNILVYSHRRDSPWHDEAMKTVGRLAAGLGTWAIPWPCIHEFFNIVTHPRIYAPPSTLKQALDQVDAWIGSPGLVLLAEANGYWTELRQLLTRGRVIGPIVHDGRIAALCALHGIRELWTADRDFSRFPALKIRNPLIV